MRRATTALGLAVMTFGVGGMLTTGGSGAQGAQTFTLLARADPAAVHLVAAQAPLVTAGELAFLTPSSAQARLDSLGTSQAFASAPYAGDFITTLPGTINGLGSGSLPPVPPFPFYVTSEHPTKPADEFDVGPYGVRAESSTDASSAIAAAGLSAVQPQVAATSATASVDRDPDTGALVATATSAIAPLAVGDILRLGEIRSTATLTYDPNDPGAGVRRESSLSIGTITVAGIELGLTDAGLTLAGVPLLALDPAFVTGLLSGLGLDIEYVPKVETPTSITSAALRVGYPTEVPTLGATTVTVILGQVQVVADHGEPVAPPRAMPPATVAGPATPATPPTVGRTLPPANNSPVPAASGTGQATARPNAGGDDNLTSGSPAMAPISLAVERFYPVLALGGLVAALSSSGGTWQRARSWIASSSGITEVVDGT